MDKYFVLAIYVYTNSGTLNGWKTWLALSDPNFKALLDASDGGRLLRAIQKRYIEQVVESSVAIPCSIPGPRHSWHLSIGACQSVVKIKIKSVLLVHLVHLSI